MEKLKEIHYKTKILAYELMKLSAYVDQLDGQLDLIAQDDNANKEALLQEIKEAVPIIEGFLEDLLVEYREGRFEAIQNSGMMRVHYAQQIKDTSALVSHIALRITQ